MMRHLLAETVNQAIGLALGFAFAWKAHDIRKTEDKMIAKFIEGVHETDGFSLGLHIIPDSDEERLLLRAFNKQADEYKQVIHIDGWEMGGDRPGIRGIKLHFRRGPNDTVAARAASLVDSLDATYRDPLGVTAFQVRELLRTLLAEALDEWEAACECTGCDRTAGSAVLKRIAEIRGAAGIASRKP